MNSYIFFLEYILIFTLSLSAKDVTDVDTSSFRPKRQALNPCSRFINPCFRKGICIPTGATSFRCECHLNLYKGENCKVVVKHCESSPCENGGTCEEAQGTYLCNCPQSHQGVNCEIEKSEVTRISKPFLIYEVDILVTYIQRFVIAFASLGTNLKIDISTGDGFSFSIQGKHFIKVINIKEWLKSKNIHGRLKPDMEHELHYVYHFNHIYTKNTYTKVRMNIFNDNYPVMEMDLPVVVHPFYGKCVPSVSLHSCGHNVKDSTKYYLNQRIVITSRVQRSCVDSKLFYKWNLFILNPVLPVLPGVKKSISSGFPGKMIFEPFTLEEGLHMLQLTVKEEAINSHYNLARCWFKIMPSSPVAVIDGGSFLTKGWDQDFTIDASTSYDPDILPGLHPNSHLTFIWSCWNELSESTSESFCKGKTKDLPQKENKLHIQRRTLQIDKIYVFQLILKKNDLNSSTSQRIRTVGGNPPKLKLVCMKNCGPKVLPSETLIYKISQYSSERKLIMNYSWDMFPGIDNQKKTIDWQSETKNGKNANFLIIFPDTLLQGDEYIFKVEGTSKNKLSSELQLSLKMVSKLNDGECKADPISGTSLLTTFKINCSGFEDFSGDSSVLNYHFYQQYKIDNVEYSLLLHYDTNPVAENLNIVPGLAADNYKTKIFVKISDWYGGYTFYNMTIEVRPMYKEWNLQEILKKCDSIIKNPALVYSIDDISGSLQNISALTDVLPGSQELKDKTKNLRMKMREIFVQNLCKINIYDISIAKQLALVLLKILSPWEAEKVSTGANDDATHDFFSAVIINLGGLLVKRVSNQLYASSSIVQGLKVAEISRTTSIHLASTLLSVGEFIIRNQTEILHEAIDNLEEYKNMYIIFEDYPNYKELEYEYQLNLKNFRQGVAWFLEGMEQLGHALGNILLKEENAVEIQTKTISFWIKIDVPLNIAGKRLGIYNTSGIFISKLLATQLQYTATEIIGIQVGIFSSNPIWWKKTPTISSDVIQACIWNAITGEKVPMIHKSDFFKLSLKMKSIIQGDGNYASALINGSLDIPEKMSEKDLIVHQLSFSCNGALMIHFDDPNDTNKIYLVAITYDNRPSLESFSEDKSIQLPHNNFKGNKELVIPIIDRPYSFKVIGSCKANEILEHQLLYLAVIPKDAHTYYGKTFQYSFRAKMVLCEHWGFTSEWSSSECQVGPESSEDYVQCSCSHLSLFGISLLAAPNKVKPFSDIKLFLGTFQNPVSGVVVSATLTIYLLLLIWSRKKDLNDRKRKLLLFLGQNYPTDICVYIVTVNTGTGDGCGTTSNVSLRLEGSNGLSRIYLLSNPRQKTLTSNSQDWFVLTTPKSLGELLNIRLWHDSTGEKPSWFCDSVVVREFEETDVVGVWVFLVNRWLSVGGLSKQPRIYYSATLPCCKVRTTTQMELIKWRLVFNNSARSNFFDKHEWLSIFKRPAHSPYTSSQRLSMAVCVLLSTMLANVMLYGIPEPEPSVHLDEGFFYFTIREWIISIEGAIIVFLLSAPPFLFFRNSEPGDLEMGKKLASMTYSLRQKFRRQGAEKVSEKDSGVPETSYFKKIKIMDENFINSTLISKLQSHSFWLPNYFRLIAWIWCVTAIIISSYLTSLYGLSFGKFKALLWISSFMLAFLQGIFIYQPLKVIGMAALDSLVMKITDGKVYSELFEHPPLEMADMTCVSTQSRDKTKKLLSSISKLSFFGGRNINVHHPKPQKITEYLARKERKWKEWSTSSVDIMCLLFYIIALYVVAYYASDPTSWNSAHVFRELLSQSLHNQGEQGPKLDSLTSKADLLDFLNLTVIPTLNARVGYNGDQIQQDEGWTANFPYKLLGAPRLRQIRVKSGLCSVPLEMNHILTDNRCIPAYNYYREDRANHGIRWEKPDKLADPEGREQKPWLYHTSEETNATIIIGHLNLYPGHGYWTELGRNLKNSRRTFEYLWKSGWFDRYTRALMIEFSTYSTDCNMFSTVSILIERGPIGIFIPSFQIQTSRLIVQDSSEYAINITSYVIFISATILLSYRHCRRYFLSYKTKKVVQTDQPPPSEPKKIQSDTKFKRLVCVIFLSADQLELKPGTSKWKVLLNFILHPKSDLPTVKSIADTGKKGLLSPASSEIPENIVSTPKYPLQPLKYPKIFEIFIVLLTFIILGLHIQQYLAIHNPLENLENGSASTERYKFFSLFDGLLWDAVFRHIIAVDVTVATMALWRALPNFRRLPTKTLSYSAKDPVPNLVIISLTLMFGFSLSAFCNSVLRATHEFSNISNAFLTLLCWSHHSPPKEDFSESLAARIIFCIFSLVSTIYLLNLFLAVLISYVEGTNKKMKLQKNFALHDSEFGVADFFYEWTQRKIPALKIKAKKHKSNDIVVTRKVTDSEVLGFPGGGSTVTRKSTGNNIGEFSRLERDEFSIEVKKIHFDAMSKLIKSWITHVDKVDIQNKGTNNKPGKTQSLPEQKKNIMNEKMISMMAFTVSQSKEQERNYILPKKYLFLTKYIDDKYRQRAINKESLNKIRERVLQMYYRNQFKEKPGYKVDWEDIVGRHHEKRWKKIDQW